MVSLVEIQYANLIGWRTGGARRHDVSTVLAGFRAQGFPVCVLVPRRTRPPLRCIKPQTRGQQRQQPALNLHIVGPQWPTKRNSAKTKGEQNRRNNAGMPAALPGAGGSRRECTNRQFGLDATKSDVAPSGNRTRVTSMATRYYTTKPTALSIVM